MTYSDLIQYLDAQKEVVIADNAHELLTNTHRYIRTPDGWALDISEGKPERVYTKGGVKFVWKRKEQE